MTDIDFSPQDGGCTCRAVRYRLSRRPLFVHCCHCTWCQRETGSAFVLNALIEAGEVKLLKGSPETIDTPSNSGRGQKILRCPSCRIALWSHYSAAGEAVHFIRVGTLDHPGLFPPDIHIFTSTKLPWVQLADGAPVVPEFYRRSDYWPKESIERYNRVLGR
jgi:hypothetical protein